VSGAYKATPTRYLESEMAVLPLDLHFDKWVADFENRIKLSKIARLLRAAGAKAAELATGHRRSRRRKRRGVKEPTTRDQKFQIMQNWKGTKKNTEKVIIDK
jgi:hypothetical protein